MRAIIWGNKGSGFMTALFVAPNALSARLVLHRCGRYHRQADESTIAAEFMVRCRINLIAETQCNNYVLQK